MYKYEPELSTNIEISRQNKKIIFSVLTKKRCVKNRSPEQLPINKNTEKAEEAFAFLDFMLSDEVTGQKGFTKGEVCYANGVDLDWDLNGITVNQKIFEENYCKL